MFRCLVINPGSTSTKIALFEDENEIWKESLSYSPDQLSSYEKIIDQLDMRRADIEKTLASKGVEIGSLAAVIGRGGPFKPLASGTYQVDDDVLNDIRNGQVQAEHISNIGALLAWELATPAGLPAYFVDPVSVDEFEPLARYSGLPEIQRKSLLHALNVKAIAHQFALEKGKKLEKLNLIVAHLGGGISICPLAKGRIVDVNNANDGGPFSPERVGTLPTSQLIKLCFSGKYDYDQLKKQALRNGGLVSYLGTNDLREVEKRIAAGDDQAREVLEAMGYQIAKEIGAMSTVLKGDVDAILLTGGMTHRERLVNWITERVSTIAPVSVYPGENEMKALMMGALRVLRGEEKAKKY